MRVLLTTISRVKLDAAKEVFPSGWIIGGCSVQSSRAEQPVNNGYECALDRIDHVDPELSACSDYLLSIENALEVKDDKVVDICYVVLVDRRSKKVFRGQSDGVLVPLEFYQQASKYPVLGSLGGFAVTVGEYINLRYPEVPKDNWMKDKRFGGLDRKDQIREAISRAKPSY